MGKHIFFTMLTSLLSKDAECGGSVGDVVAQLAGMWWLSWGCGGSVG
jgi:hypothetical protein